jgi:glutamate racemase
LGCTHYPFLSPLIRKIIGNKINLIDTGDAVIKQLARQLLLQMPIRNSANQVDDAHKGRLTLITSGDCNKLLHMSEQLLQSPLHQRQVSAQQLLVQ